MSRMFSKLVVVVFVALLVLPSLSLAQSPQDAATAVEAAILEAMTKSGQSGPTLGQLGGVQGGSTDSDASGGAGGDGSGGGSGGSSGGSSGGCFAPDTLVLMADGASKPIKDIKVGDKVASWDFDKNAMVTVAVEHVYTVQRDHFYMVDGIRVTAEHPYCTAPGQYTEVQFLKKGTPIASVTDGGVQFAPVAEFAKVDKAGTFHNVAVSGAHTYIVHPAGQENEKRVVHNKSAGNGGI